MTARGTRGEKIYKVEVSEASSKSLADRRPASAGYTAATT